MTNKASIIILFALLSLVPCLGQSSYKGLTPGKSTRAEAERVFGQPVKKVSETLIEYGAQPLTSKVYVQYRKDSVIERSSSCACSRSRAARTFSINCIPR